MSDPKPLFNPSMVLPMPSKNQKGSNFREAIPKKSSEPIPEKLKIEDKKIEVATKVKKEKIIKAEKNIEKEKELTPSTKTQSKLNGRLRTNYFIDKRVIRYIDNISGELKFYEVQNYYSQTVAEEFFKISKVLYEMYKHKLVDTITNGDQIAEFILREFKKEFNIVDE